MPSYAIEAHELTRTFGSFTAVDRISFAVERGEIFGFLGANGAGKSTAIKMLTGLLRLSGGRATVAGLDLSSQAERIKRSIGYMSQRFSLYDDLTVAENVRFYGGIYGLRGDELRRRGAEAIEQLGLGAERNTLVRALPLGWKQKLAFSVAGLHRPEIIFLDEPTSGVDPQARRQFWELIYAAAAQGTTVFVTTHYMDEAEYCGRISMMVAGRIAALGTPAQLRQQFAAADLDAVFLTLAR